jgi:hypothetical protein
VADDQPLAHLGDAAVAELDHLREVVAGVDVQQREGQAALVSPSAPFDLEGLLGQAQHDARILAAREQQGGRSNAATVSRRMKIASSSSQSRCVWSSSGSSCSTVKGAFMQRLRSSTRRLWFRARAGRTPWPSHLPPPAAGAEVSPTAMARVHGAQPMLGMNSSCSGL